VSEQEAYEKLQELLGMAEELKASDYYSTEEIIEEINHRLGE
jgi:hypothetical protein